MQPNNFIETEMTNYILQITNIWKIDSNVKTYAIKGKKIKEIKIDEVKNREISWCQKANYRKNIIFRKILVIVSIRSATSLYYSYMTHNTYI